MPLERQFFTISTINNPSLSRFVNLGGGGGGQLKKVNTHPKIPEIDLDFFRLLLTFKKSSKFCHKIILRCIGDKHMVTYDIFKTIVTQ